MAPGVLTASAPVPSHHPNGGGLPASIASSSSPALDRRLFPDGLKTSGQHPPDPSALFPYAVFPKEIQGRTLWRRSDFERRKERWTRPFTPEEIEELGKAADGYIATGRPMTAMSQELFPLPTLGPYFSGELRDELLNGRGFVLFKNIPVEEWGDHKSAVAYMGLGTYFGYFVSQNGKGHVLGHVKDLGEDPTKTERVRIYRTNARQFFHTDGTDLVGLLCISPAQEGGESDIASTHNIWNILQREYPDVAETLTTPNWYFDRKGEVSKGQGEYYQSAVMFLENAPESELGSKDKDSQRRLWLRFDPNNVTSLSRFNSGPNPEIPPLSPEQLHAIKTLEEVAKREALHMVLEPGDIQLLANHHVMHARTAYTDWPAGSVDEKGRARKRRQLMRLWLAAPETEGGWKLPYPDSKQKKRGGIQVDDTPPYCPLDAE